MKKEKKDRINVNIDANLWKELRIISSILTIRDKKKVTRTTLLEEGMVALLEKKKEELSKDIFSLAELLDKLDKKKE